MGTRVIEANLDSITRTPCTHRDELDRHVHVPKLLKIDYLPDLVDSQTWSPVLKALISCVEDMEDRLKIQTLRLLSEEEIGKLSAGVLERGKWNSQAQEQLKRFSTRARYIQEELGPWAADYYITESIERMTLSMYSQQNRRLGWQDEQTIHILYNLGRIGLSVPNSNSQIRKDMDVSNKCISMLHLLQKEYNNNFRGIIFVEQRVTASVLNHLLSVHPRTKNLFKCGIFLGVSTHQSKKMEIRDLLDTQDQQNTLGDFREGRKNLLIATSALEEGIDISACNMVICFNKPPNLKSFIQRRGRARQEKSAVVFLSSLDDEVDIVAIWQKMESDMVAEYMREGRNLVAAGGISPDEGSNESRMLKVDTTGYAQYACIAH